MQRFSREITDHQIDLRTGWMANDVALTRRQGREGQWWILSTCHRLPEHQKIVGIAIMVQVIKLGWPGSQFRFRFPLATDEAPMRRGTARTRRDYRRPYDRALHVLMPDAFLFQMEREERSPAEVCELAGVGMDDLEARFHTWELIRNPHAPIPF